MLGFEIPSMEALLVAIMGVIYPFIAEKLKSTFLSSKTGLMLVGGVIGSVVAIAANYILVHFGMAEPQSLNALIVLAFGIEIPIAETVYRKKVKPEAQAKLTTQTGSNLK